jgi:hypothetical protein
MGLIGGKAAATVMLATAACVPIDRQEKVKSAFAAAEASAR